MEHCQLKESRGLLQINEEKQTKRVSHSLCGRTSGFCFCRLLGNTQAEMFCYYWNSNYSAIRDVQFLLSIFVELCHILDKSPTVQFPVSTSN